MRLAKYAEQCKKAADKAGHVWGPDHSRDAEYAEMARVPGIQLYEEELRSDFCWNEDDVIEAIDRKYNR